VAGGLLVAVAAKYNEVSGNLTSLQRLKPTLYSNAGRVVSYTLLGGAVGALGSTLTLSPAVNGILTIVASAVMILPGPANAQAVPGADPLHADHAEGALVSYPRIWQSAILGGAPSFWVRLPSSCLVGSTQALQLYVLAKASFVTGALTMLAFSVGTLPALLSLSAMSSFATGGFQRRFLTFAGLLSSSLAS